MKTTLMINDTVFASLKREAVRQGKSMSELVEAALRLFLTKKPPAGRRIKLPTFNSGGHLVDISDREALYRAMEEEGE